MKRSRQSSCENQENCPQLVAEEKISSAKRRKVAVAPCPSEKPRALQRGCFSEGRPKASSRKRRKPRLAWSESDKYSVKRKSRITEDYQLLDSKVTHWLNKNKDEPKNYSLASSGSSVYLPERPESCRLEFLKELCSDNHLAKYDLGDVIGCGSFGQVIAATRKADYMPVAIKFVAKESVREFKELNGQRIPAEAYLQNKAQHHHVIKIIEIFTTEDHYVYVMERPEVCKDLFDVLQVKVILSEKEARRYLAQVLEANISCEENGVIHRDLKPENILLDMRNDEIKLIDFGLASEVQDEPFNKFRGTNAYTPPEYFRTGRYDGCQGTVWQMGILLVEILSPVMAFDQPEQALKMEPRIPEQLSPGNECECCSITDVHGLKYKHGEWGNQLYRKVRK
ncbi:Serine/threonine-protein kinase pim-3 [Desmophyllum pertusum]|uniref:Serine/threonine-protein kinase 1 n=1 Tax=Desmophyllum pertusum TaxID=174260 RepID=A0A9X0CDZ0_9CNID|nr:Serine/threonine-protein kinase pim-3 [Desmophyllum pertusum]